MTRHEERELALIVLYQADLVAAQPVAAFARTAQLLGLSVPEPELAYARQLVEGVLAHRDEIDQYLGEYSQGWAVSRMAVVDRNLLRIALFELLYSPHVPAAVAVDEAVELAKVYGDTDSSRFTNGILGAFVRDHPRPAPASPKRSENDQTSEPSPSSSPSPTRTPTEPIGPAPHSGPTPS